MQLLRQFAQHAGTEVGAALGERPVHAAGAKGGGGLRGEMEGGREHAREQGSNNTCMGKKKSSYHILIIPNCTHTYH